LPAAESYSFFDLLQIKKLRDLRAKRVRSAVILESLAAMRQVAGTLKLELAQYRELAAFAQFGSDLDKATQAQLNRGKRLVEILKQDQYQPLSFGKQIMIIFAGTNGYLDDLEVEDVRAFSEELNKYVESMNPKLLSSIMEKKTIDDSIKADMEKTLKEFKQRFVSERQAAAAKV